MFNIKTKKKCFLGIILAIFFNTAAFGINVTALGSYINTYLSAVENLAYVEYKTNTEYTDLELQSLVNSELKFLIDIAILDPQSIPTTKLYKFSQKLINITNKMRFRIKSKCIAGTYKNHITNLRSLDQFGSVFRNSNIVLVFSRPIFMELINFFNQGLVFLNNQYKDFTVELTNTEILYYEKISIFNAVREFNKNVPSAINVVHHPYFM